MVIFHSYVSLPEGNLDFPKPFCDSYPMLMNATSGPLTRQGTNGPGLFQLAKVVLFFLIVIVLMFTPPSHPCLPWSADENRPMSRSHCRKQQKLPAIFFQSVPAGSTNNTEMDQYNLHKNDIDWLVVPTPLKISVSWDDYSHIIYYGK